MEEIYELNVSTGWKIIINHTKKTIHVTKGEGELKNKYPANWKMNAVWNHIQEIIDSRLL